MKFHCLNSRRLVTDCIGQSGPVVRHIEGCGVPLCRWRAPVFLEQQVCTYSDVDVDGLDCHGWIAGRTHINGKCVWTGSKRRREDIKVEQTIIGAILDHPWLRICHPVFKRTTVQPYEAVSLESVGTSVFELENFKAGRRSAARHVDQLGANWIRQRKLRCQAVCVRSFEVHIESCIVVDHT